MADLAAVAGAWNPPLTPGSLLLNARQTAKALGISDRTLFTETKAGRIPVVRIGRSVRYDVRDLVAYIDARKQGGPRS